MNVLLINTADLTDSTITAIGKEMKMKDGNNLFFLNGKGAYAPIIFEHRSLYSAIATAIYTESALSVWDKGVSEWESLYSPHESDNNNRKWLGKHGITLEELSEECPYSRCSFSAMFLKTDAYYYCGSGVVVLPERIVIGRNDIFSGKALPTCSLDEYDIYSVSEYHEMEFMLHEMPFYYPGNENPDSESDDSEVKIAGCESEDSEAETADSESEDSEAETTDSEPQDSESEDEDVIVIEPGAKFKRVYPYLPYSHWRIKQILNDYFNAHLKCVRAYKEGRYRGYKQRYYIYDNATNKLLEKDVRLDTLRYRFAKLDIPLQESDTERNPGAKSFLETVKKINEQQK